MPLINLQPSGALPPELAWDSEVTAAIADHEAKTDPHPVYLTQAESEEMIRQALVKSLSVAPRTGGSTGLTIDANNAIAPGRAAAIRWIDGNNTYVNFPFSTASGTLYQFDALFNSSIVGKYMNQLFTMPDQSKIYYRSQNNGVWIGWVAL
jgi:hypothetical protein